MLPRRLASPSTMLRWRRSPTVFELRWYAEASNPVAIHFRTLVPVSIRSNDAQDATDNRVSVMLPFLPVDKEDPAEQLQAVHRRLTRAKSSGQRQAGGIFVAAVMSSRSH